MLVLFFAIAAQAQFAAQSVGNQPINFKTNGFLQGFQGLPLPQAPVYQPPKRVQTNCFTYWIGDQLNTRCDSE